MRLTLLLLAVPFVAATQSPAPPPYRVHGDTLWTTSSVGVMRTVQRGDTLWALLTMPNEPPMAARYVIRGALAYATIKGADVVVPAMTLPQMKDYREWRGLDSIARMAVKTTGQPPE